MDSQSPSCSSAMPLARGENCQQLRRVRGVDCEMRNERHEGCCAKQSQFAESRLEGGGGRNLRALRETKPNLGWMGSVGKTDIVRWAALQQRTVCETKPIPGNTRAGGKEMEGHRMRNKANLPEAHVKINLCLRRELCCNVRVPEIRTNKANLK